MRVVVVVVALFSSALVPSVARANGAVRVPPLPSVGVLKSLVPSGPATVSYLTGPDGRVTTNPTGATRHTLAVGRLVDNYGTGVDIVEQRLYVFTQTGEDASAMLARTHGSVVDEQTITPPVGAGPSTTWTMSTIIVSMKNVVTTTLRQDLRTLDARARGWMKVSDPNLLRTVAIAAHEAAMFHTRVSLDFRANSTSIADGSTTEAASSNAFTWDGYTRRPTDVLRTGVVESWQALDIASKAGPVDVVVSDGGFVPGREVPMTVDPPSAINVNPAKCGGNSLCPWHGTGTAATIGGVVDNHLGAAGTGAPVVRMHAESMAADLWGAISQASKTGSFIINTSWRAVIPALVAFSLEPITSLVRFYYAMGIVIVASAGNDSIDVDAHDCSSTCWETSVTYPCELSDVICVGAVEPSDGSKSGYSNYGSLQRSTKDGAAQDDGSVDIYAPGTTQITGLPSTATLPAATNDNVVSTFSGTSAAAPFVTGVLALMQAADP